MSDLPPIAVVLKADTTDFTRGIDQARKSIDDIDPAAKRGGGALGALKFAAVAGAAAFAAKGLADFAGSALSAAQESVLADNRLNAIAKSMGYVGGAFSGTTDRLKEYASTLSTTIGVEDESIKSTQGVLLTFKNLANTANEAGGMFDRATTAAYDLASAGFGSAESNAKQLGKALQDPIKGITALARAGVTFTEKEKERIKALVESNRLGEAQQMVLAGIEKQVGGVAKATATGVDKMKVAFGELKEAVGGPLANLMNSIADALIPVLNSMQGPLKDVAATVGGGLKQAFQALAPFLPTLAKALGTVAQTLGGVLSSAITALIPIVTPLLDVLGQLVSGVGARLAPLLTKLSELFTKLLSALMPLLQPLIDLVFTILDAAMPIIMTVADVLGILIDALAPLLKIVGSLLTPLGQLINVLFKAIAPILKPIMPIIQLLAGLLANVLARAIGLLITSIGYLIIGWSKLAPFVLNNVAIPVVKYFLEMVDQVVSAAAEMFAWVPGIGDKLNQAKTVIGQFKTDAAKAIGDAATTIEAEGSKIGQGLVDQGVATMIDPDNINALGNAGYNAGLAAAQGMAAGAGVALEEKKLSIQERGKAKPTEKPKPVTTASSGGGSGDKGLSDAQQKRLDALQAQVDRFTSSLDTAHASIVTLNDATKKAFGEPSRILQSFGSTSEISGVISQYDELDGALKNYYESMRKMPEIGDKTEAKLKKQEKAQRASLKQMTTQIVGFMRERAGLQKQLEKLDKDYEAQQKSINATYDDLEAKAKAAIDAVNTKWEGIIPGLEKAANDATAAFERENKALEALSNERNSFLNNLANGFTSFMNSLSIDEGAGSFKASMQKRLDQVKEFTTNIRTLLAKGLDPTLIKQFVTAGVGSAGSVVAELVASAPDDLSAINNMQKELAATSEEFQTTVSSQWFDAGIAAQQAIVGPLETAKATAVTALEVAKTSYASELKAAEDHAVAMKNARDAMLDQAEKDYELSKEKINQSIDGVNKQINDTAAKIDAQFAVMADPDKGLPAKMAQIGTDSMNGLLAGMESMRGELKKKAKSLAEAMNQAFRDHLKISSPSRVMHLIGQQVGQGLVDGMDSMQSNVIDASSRLARAAVPTIGVGGVDSGMGATSTTNNHYSIPVNVTSQADPYEISKEIAWNLKLGAA